MQTKLGERCGLLRCFCDFARALQDPHAPHLVQVTLSGLFLLIFTYLLCFVYNHDLDSGIPAWASFLAAVTLALYAVSANGIAQATRCQHAHFRTAFGQHGREASSTHWHIFCIRTFV